MAKEQLMHLPVLFIKKKFVHEAHSKAEVRLIHGEQVDPLTKPYPGQRLHSDCMFVSGHEKQRPLLLENWYL
jgi:hypothetical protein